jgi:soluble lytic murein transglycosylase-like protein
MRGRFPLACLLAATLVATVAHADMYSYVDDQGVIHITNIPQKGGPWKLLYKTAPEGRGSAPRETCQGCDVVPAKDSSPDRYTRYDAYIDEAAALYQIPAALIKGVIQTESDFDPHVVSSAGAMGLMQLMPDEVASMHLSDAYDPRQNILGGTRCLRVLANRYHGDIVLTLAGYNAGPGAVDKYGGIPPYQETQLYVRKVLKFYYGYQKQEAESAASQPATP